MTVYISKIPIGQSFKPFVIAEMSGNHNHSLEKALEIVEAAAKSGATMIKLQTYTADTITMNVDKDDFKILDKKNLWYGNTLHELYKKAYTPWEWHEPIFKKAKELGLLYTSTPFDETAVDFLEDLNVPAYKIASFENNHINLIEKVAKTNKPIILSTGMMTLTELEQAVNCIKNYGNENLILLKCTSNYPATTSSCNLATIPILKKMFNCEVGLSDHTLGIGVSLAAVALGATVIEKHLTISRKEGGVDSEFSIEPEEFKVMIKEINAAKESIGDVKFGPTEEEKGSLKYKRSIYFSENLSEGEKITKENIKIVRPGLGLDPKFYKIILGLKVRKKIEKGTPVSWDLFKD